MLLLHRLVLLMDHRHHIIHRWVSHRLLLVLLLVLLVLMRDGHAIHRHPRRLLLGRKGHVHGRHPGIIVHHILLRHVKGHRSPPMLLVHIVVVHTNSWGETHPFTRLWIV